MPDRQDEIAAFLRQTNWAAASLSTLASDASARRYFRLTKAGDTAVLMDAPPHSGQDIEAFVRIAHHLRDYGVSAPKIFDVDGARGFILMEDLGDALFARRMQNEEPGALYSAAVDLLIHLRDVPRIEGLKHFDAKTLASMVTPFFDWYAKGLGWIAEKAEQERVFDQLETVFSDFVESAEHLTLRDFHAENLIWLPERDGIARVGVLDFQDAVIAHPAYDLVSMLQDARRDVEPEIETAMLDRYLGRSVENADAFRAAYALLGLQRNLRILGVFARLALSLGKPGYIRFIPRVWGYVQRNLQHPVLEEVRPFLSAIPDPTKERLAGLKADAA